MNTTHSVGFEPVHAVRTLLSGLTVPYWITGGWAIDPAAGHVTRDHADVNIMMLERHEHALRGLTGVDIQLIADGAPAGSLARRAPADRWTCRDGWFSYGALPGQDPWLGSGHQAPAKSCDTWRCERHERGRHDHHAHVHELLR